MDVKLEPGRYVLAVSGGVDSMVLLDLLRQKPAVDLLVAHFNHGIRSEGDKDEALVRKVAKRHGLRLEMGQGNLGPKTSEDKARAARYDFLRTVKQKHRAKTIITAHHQDDLIETALINMLRGTGGKGLTAIKRNPQLGRPLLDTPKEAIIRYAREYKLEWREDQSNWDKTFLRNYIRHQLIPKLTPQDRTKLLKNIDKVAKIQEQVDSLITTISQNINKGNVINREEFSQLPSEVADELTLYWLRLHEAPDPDRKTVQRLSLAIKTARPGTAHNVRRQLWLETGHNKAYFTTTVPKGLV